MNEYGLYKLLTCIVVHKSCGVFVLVFFFSCVSGFLLKGFSASAIMPFISNNLNTGLKDLNRSSVKRQRCQIHSATCISVYSLRTVLLSGSSK